MQKGEKAWEQDLSKNQYTERCGSPVAGRSQPLVKTNYHQVVDMLIFCEMCITFIFWLQGISSIHDSSVTSCDSDDSEVSPVQWQTLQGCPTLTAVFQWSIMGNMTQSGCMCNWSRLELDLLMYWCSKWNALIWQPLTRNVSWAVTKLMLDLTAKQQPCKCDKLMQRWHCCLQ